MVADDDTAATSVPHQRLVEVLREASASAEASVGGPAAALVDSKNAIGRGLLPALAFVLIATLLVVFLLTGSAVLPVVVVAMNALSLTAMFGAVVWVFQDGHLSGLLDFTATGDVETTLPVLMFCVAFGLSMDYGVFLIARMKEEFDRGGDHRAAVAHGMRTTGGLITAAAVVLSVVFVSIGLSRITNTKLLGFGIALAVLVDALVVRTLLVPAVMRLLGPRAWWAPRPLLRAHRRFGLREEPAADLPADASAAPEPPERTQHERHAASR